MKPKLACCENNQKSPNAQWECSYCECAFEDEGLRDAHNREIHLEQMAAKRKMKCCEENEEKRQKLDHHQFPEQCLHCECKFREKSHRDVHMNSAAHRCKCGEMLLTADVQNRHKTTHAQEAKLEKLQAKRETELEKLQSKRQREMDEDFVLVYVKANKLNEYRPQLDYKPNFHYILNSHRFEGDELVRFVKKFKKEFLKFITQNWNRFKSAEIIHLAENDALSLEDVASFLELCLKYLREDIITTLVSYLLDKEHTIKPEWVAHLMGDDKLIRRIKQKHAFTFHEIYEAREKGQLYFCYRHNLKEFRAKVQKHFPDPNFVENSDSDSDWNIDWNIVDSDTDSYTDYDYADSDF